MEACDRRNINSFRWSHTSTVQDEAPLGKNLTAPLQIKYAKFSGKNYSNDGCCILGLQINSHGNNLISIMDGHWHLSNANRKKKREKKKE